MPPNQNQFPVPPPVSSPTPPGQSDHDPYAFFMEPGKAPKHKLLGGNSSNSKLLLITGGIVGFILLIVLLASLSSGGNKSTQQVMSLAQTQQEVIRVAKDGSKNARSTDLKNFATTTIVSLTSDQRLLLAQLAKNGKKIQPKDLNLGKNPQTDQALAAALAANTYDVTFTTTMDSELKDYITKLKDEATVAGPSGEALLKQEITNGVNLRKQLQVLLPTASSQ